MPEDYNSQSEHTVVFLVAPGDILDDRWLIEARIGQGAMGSVFRGKDSRLERKVAIKILAPEHCRKPKVLARFEREAKLMQTLRHPNIIQLFGVGRRGALPYIVMQFLEGMTLADVLKKKGNKLSPGETMAVVKQIAAGLSFIHHHGLVHRDIKPQNVFVSPGGRVTILDLGVVRDKANPGLTKAGAMVGTPYYMSPEQIQGTDEIDKRTDVYALAAMTFELLCGRPPFLGQSNFEVLHAHRYLDVPDASELNKAVNKNVARAIATAMSKKRDDRPLSATEFSADLEAFFGLAEKVDPEVAFAFLDEEEKKPKKVAKPSTRAPTQPMLKAQGDKRTTSGEVPMARSHDVHLLSGAPTGPISIPAKDRAGAAADTQGGDLSAEHTPAAPVPPPRAPRKSARSVDTREQEREAEEPEEEEKSQTFPGDSAADEDETGERGATASASETVTETGELRVITTLKGLTTSASVYVDGRKQGTTPMSIQVPAGRHQVRIERQGYRTQEKSAVVSGGQVALVRIELASAK